MSEPDRHRLFSDLITQHHSQLYAYIFAVVKNRADAEDLFQSVCLVLWRKFPAFQPDTNFFSWARQTAKFVLCSFLRHKKNLSDQAGQELLDAIATPASTVDGDAQEVYLAAMRRCREKLQPTDQELLDLRYVEELGIREIAARLGRQSPNVCRSLNRIRRCLLDCIEMEIARQDHPGANHDA